MKIDVDARDERALLRYGVDAERVDNLIGACVAARARVAAADHALALARAEWEDARNQQASAEQKVRSLPHDWLAWVDQAQDGHHNPGGV